MSSASPSTGTASRKPAPCTKGYSVGSSTKKKKNKKDAQLVLRLQKDVRDRFVDACDDLDTSAAREVRRFIKRFLRRYEKGDLHD